VQNIGRLDVVQDHIHDFAEYFTDLVLDDVGPARFLLEYELMWSDPNSLSNPSCLYSLL